MRLRVKVTTKYDPLNIRSGPGTSYKVVGTLAIGTEVIVNNQKNVGSDIWYKLEDGRGWICAKPASVNYNYATVIANLEQPNPPQPVPQNTGKSSGSGNPSGHSLINDVNKDNVIDETIMSNMYKGNTNKATGNVYGTNYNSTDEDYDKLMYELTPKTGWPTYIGYENGVGIYDYFMDYSFIQSDLKNVKEALSIYTDILFSDVNKMLFNNFNRFRAPFTDYTLTNTVAYIFITRPDLNILEPTGNNGYKLVPQFENDPTFTFLFKHNPNILLSLTSHFSNQHDFHPFLSNMAESFEVSDQYIKTIEHGETLTGYKIQYGKHNIESKTAGKFNITYTDDKEVTIYKIHKAWTEYISKVYRGEASPKRTYIERKILDYACSVYYILCAQDYETILFWTKYYGVFPTNEPSSVFSSSKSNPVKNPEYSIEYAYAFKEDFNPLTLCEFNMNSKGNYIYLKPFNTNTGKSGRSLTGAPFIETSRDGNYVFKLKFRKMR